MQELDLPGRCWAETRQLALVRPSSLLPFDACNALGGSDRSTHSNTYHVVGCLRATINRSTRATALVDLLRIANVDKAASAATTQAAAASSPASAATAVDCSMFH